MTKEGSQLLDKASRAIRAATRLLAEDDTDFAASRAYYAMFYCVQALLTEKGLRFSKHSGAIGAFGAHFAKTGDLDPHYHRWLLDAFDKRQIGDYCGLDHNSDQRRLSPTGGRGFSRWRYPTWPRNQWHRRTGPAKASTSSGRS